MPTVETDLSGATRIVADLAATLPRVRDLAARKSKQHNNSDLPEGYDDDRSPFWVDPVERDDYRATPAPTTLTLDEQLDARSAVRRFHWKYVDPTGIELGMDPYPSAQERRMDATASPNDAEQTAALLAHRAAVSALRARRAARKAEREAEQYRVDHTCPVCGCEDVEVSERVPHPQMLVKVRACGSCLIVFAEQLTARIAKQMGQAKTPNGRRSDLITKAIGGLNTEVLAVDSDPVELAVQRVLAAQPTTGPGSGRNALFRR